MVNHIIVGRDYEQRSPDYAYLAYLSYNFCKEACGPTEDAAIENLVRKYPEAIDLPVFGREPRAGLNRRKKRENAADALGCTAFAVIAALAVLGLLGLRGLFLVW